LPEISGWISLIPESEFIRIHRNDQKIFLELARPLLQQLYGGQKAAQSATCEGQIGALALKWSTHSLNETQELQS